MPAGSRGLISTATSCHQSLLMPPLLTVTGPDPVGASFRWTQKKSLTRTSLNRWTNHAPAGAVGAVALLQSCPTDQISEPVALGLIVTVGPPRPVLDAVRTVAAAPRYAATVIVASYPGPRASP